MHFNLMVTITYQIAHIKILSKIIFYLPTNEAWFISCIIVVASHCFPKSTGHLPSLLFVRTGSIHFLFKNESQWPACFQSNKNDIECKYIFIFTQMNSTHIGSNDTHMGGWNDIRLSQSEANLESFAIFNLPERSWFWENRGWQFIRSK